MLFRKNVNYIGKKRNSAWRKVAIGTWRTVGDPSVYGVMELRVERALNYIEQLNSTGGPRITLTHFVAKVVGDTLKRHPQLNCVLRFGTLYQRRNVDVFLQVATDKDGKDLSGLTVRNVDQKSVTEIADEIAKVVRGIRERGDRPFKSKSMFANLPGFVARWLLNFNGFLSYKLNIWSSLLGSPQDPFGSIMLTNTGSLGIEHSFAPLVPYSHCPIVLALCATHDAPVVENGQVVPGKVLKLCVTFDHRLVDGVHAGRMSETIKKIFADPERELSQP